MDMVAKLMRDIQFYQGLIDELRKTKDVYEELCLIAGDLAVQLAIERTERKRLERAKSWDENPGQGGT